MGHGLGELILHNRDACERAHNRWREVTGKGIGKGKYF